MIKSVIEQLGQSSWFMTLFATMFGVLLAFYLDGCGERSSMRLRKASALDNVEREVHKNIEELQESGNNDSLAMFLYSVSQIDKDYPSRLTLPADTAANWRQQYGNFFNIIDSTFVEDGVYEYSFSYSLVLHLFNLQSIAWESVKLGGVANELNYNCLEQLIDVYSLQDLFTVEERKLLDHFASNDKGKVLIGLVICSDILDELNIAYESALEGISNCY